MSISKKDYSDLVKRKYDIEQNTEYTWEITRVYEDREKEGEEVGVLVLDIQGILAILPQ